MVSDENIFLKKKVLGFWFFGVYFWFGLRFGEVFFSGFLVWVVGGGGVCECLFC